MNSDHAYVIGSTHDRCEDYATSDTGMAIISDGCSGSKNSHIGSMLLCEISKEFITKGHVHSSSFLTTIINKAETITNILGHQTEALDATLIGITFGDHAVISGDNTTYYADTFIAGDGYIVERYDNKMIVHKYTSPTGYPYYLSYKLWERQVEIDEEGPQIYTEYTKQTYILSNDGIKLFNETKPLHLKNTHINSIEIRPNMTISVISDGAGAVYNNLAQSIPDHLTLKELTSFKNTKGRFVQRRLNGFMKKVKSERWKYEDDISIATLCF